MLRGFESDDNAMDGGEMRGKKLIRERLQPLTFAVLVPSPWHPHGQIHVQQDVFLYWLDGCG